MSAMSYPITGEELRLADCEADMDARRKARQREASLAQRCTELEQRVNAQELLLAEETARRIAVENELAWLVSRDQEDERVIRQSLAACARTAAIEQEDTK